MRFWKILAILGLIEIILSFIPRIYAAEIYLDVTKKRSSIIAAPDFIGTPKEKDIAQELSQILRNDLKLSSFFTPIGEDEASSDAQSISYWFSLGADLFISATVIKRDDIIKLEARLYETGTGRNRLAKSYHGKTSARRLIVHRLSDDIVQELTGLKGIATTYIAFVHGEGMEKEIYVMDYDGASPRQLTNHRSISLDPAWSPDGKKIAYMSYKNGNPNLYLIDRHGGDSKLISFFPGLNAHPSWKNNTEFALTLSKDGNPEIYCLDIDRNIKGRLTRNKKIDSSPCWSPDGEWIAFTSDREGSPKIYVMKKNGDGVKCLTPKFSYADSANWSPLGDFIAFTGRIAGQFNVFIIRPDGTGLKQITSGHGDNEAPSWAPNNRHIAFSSNRDGKRSIYITDIYGLEETKIAVSNGDSYSPSWSPY